MKIYSGFYDYYDNAVGHDSDDTINYRRERREISLAETRTGQIEELLSIVDSMPFIYRKRRRKSYGVTVHRLTVAFCGRAYPLYEYADQYYTSINALISNVESGAAVSEETQRFKQLLPTFREEEGSFYRPYTFSEKGWERWLSNFSSKISDGPFIHYDAPVILVRRRHESRSPEIEINPPLEPLGFASIVDPFTAYQELSMYIGNNLAKQEDPNLIRSQEAIRDSHGFDGMSFKQASEDNKKARRRANKKKKLDAK